MAVEGPPWGLLELGAKAASAVIDRLGATIPTSGSLHVEGGTDQEMMRTLDFAPIPDRPARLVFAPGLISADLERLADLQQGDRELAAGIGQRVPRRGARIAGMADRAGLSILQANSRTGAGPPT